MCLFFFFGVSGLFFGVVLYIRKGVTFKSLSRGKGKERRRHVRLPNPKTRGTETEIGDASPSVDKGTFEKI